MKKKRPHRNVGKGKGKNGKPNEKKNFGNVKMIERLKQRPSIGRRKMKEKRGRRRREERYEEERERKDAEIEERLKEDEEYRRNKYWGNEGYQTFESGQSDYSETSDELYSPQASSVPYSRQTSYVPYSTEPWYRSTIFMVLTFFVMPPLWAILELTNKKGGCILKPVAVLMLISTMLYFIFRFFPQPILNMLHYTTPIANELSSWTELPTKVKTSPSISQSARQPMQNKIIFNQLPLV